MPQHVCHELQGLRVLWEQRRGRSNGVRDGSSRGRFLRVLRKQTVVQPKTQDGCIDALYAYDKANYPMVFAGAEDEKNCRSRKEWLC